MSKKKMFMMIGILLLIIIMIFLFFTFRKYSIIMGLQDKVSKYANSTNYHIKSCAQEENGVTVSIEYYKKDDKEVIFIERNLNEEITKISMYNNGERTDTFIETKDSKIARLNNGTVMSMNIINYLETENNWQTFVESMKSKLRQTEYNGKECYVINGFVSLASLTYEGAEVYLEKDTGLCIKTVEGERVTTREYEFENVEDSIFIEPDIGQYTLK